jgi:hypothetical protein
MADIINQGTMTTKARRKFDKQLQAVYAAVVPAETVLATSVSHTARIIGTQFFTNPVAAGAGGGPGVRRNYRSCRQDCAAGDASDAAVHPSSTPNAVSG